MKKWIVMMIIGLLFVPSGIHASEKSKVPVYLFRGEGCSHCEETLAFFASLDDQEKEKFELTTLEVWNDADHKKLMKNVAKTLKETVNGVPYIVIGEKTFNGFDESIGESILEIIDTMYETNDTTDIVKPLQAELGKVDIQDIIIISVVGGVILAGIGLAIWARRKNA